MELLFNYLIIEIFFSIKKWILKRLKLKRTIIPSPKRILRSSKIIFELTPVGQKYVYDPTANLRRTRSNGILHVRKCT